MFVFYEWPFPFANNVANIVFFSFNSWLSFQQLCRFFLGGGITIRPHRTAKRGMLLQTLYVSWPVNLCLYALGTPVSLAKTDEPIEMGADSREPKEQCITCGARWRHLANTTE